MADKTIKHFIAVRFFPFQDSRYPHDVFDVDFLAKQVQLAKNNALKSLENQSNKNFELIFFVNDRFFLDKKYEFIFTTLKSATTVPIRFIKTHQEGTMSGITPEFNLVLTQNEFPNLVNDALKEYDFVINSRIDYDDFIHKDIIADTQNKVNECDSILLYGYCKGYQYIYGELYPHFWAWNGLGHHSVLQSLILKSSFAKNLPFLNMYHHHGKSKIVLKNFCQKNKVEFSESMFQQNTTTNAYIYFRHEFSLWQLVSAGTPQIKIPRDKPLTTADITKTQLAKEFGFHYELKSIKDKEFVFDYDFKSTQAEELGFRQNLMSINWVE